jgi:hypothetical protein
LALFLLLSSVAAQRPPADATGISPLDLDRESLRQILSRLNGRDLCSLSRTCKDFYKDELLQMRRRLLAPVLDPELPALLREGGLVLQEVLLSMTETEFVWLYDRIVSHDPSPDALLDTAVSRFQPAFTERFGSLLQGLRDSRSFPPESVNYEKLNQLVAPLLGHCSSHLWSAAFTRSEFLFRMFLAGCNDELLRPEVLLAFVRCGIRFNYVRFVGFVDCRSVSGRKIIPLLQSPIWRPFEEMRQSKVDFKTLGNFGIRPPPLLIEHYRSIEADSFKPIVEAENRETLWRLEGPILAAVLGTREKEGGGTLFNWIVQQNDEELVTILMSKFPLNLGNDEEFRAPIAPPDSASRPDCSQHSSLLWMREAMQSYTSQQQSFRTGTSSGEHTDSVGDLLDAFRANNREEFGRLLNARDASLGDATILHCAILQEDAPLVLNLLEMPEIVFWKNDESGRVAFDLMSPSLLLRLLRESTAPVRIAWLIESHYEKAVHLVREIVTSGDLDGMSTLLHHAELFRH